VANLLHVSTSLKKNRLSNMVLDFVSLVPAGDNPQAQVVISKAAPDQPAGGPMGEPISKEDLAPEVVEYIDGLETEVDDLTKSVEDLTTQRDEAQENLKKAEEQGLIVKSEEEQRKALLEKADPGVRALIEKQEKDLEEVRKAAEAERNQRLEREYLSKAEAMPMISEDKTALGGLLRRISDALSAEDAEQVEKMLQTANEQIAKGNLFSEFGTGGGETTISKSVESAASELQKADPNLTHEQAVAKVYETNPDLLAEAMQNKEG
jgi:hypothetical protein